MSHHLDYSGIGWEAFEDLCTNLWFDEGYTNIKPYGRRREGGRDAVFADQYSKELTIFQFKRWTGNYSVSDLKTKIKKAVEEIVSFQPKRFILNSAYNPNPEINDWIPNLQSTFGFDIEYWDRSWTDLRLDNKRQDLRRLYFGVGLEHHSWESLLSVSSKQIERALKILSNKFDRDLYVNRDAENKFRDFIQTNKIAIVLIDRAGSGKTNLLCNLASGLISKKAPVVFLQGNMTLTDDHSLERAIISELGYVSFNEGTYHNFFTDISRLLQERKEKCYLFLDGISETNNLHQISRSLKNLLSTLSEFGCFQLCISCRDMVWPLIEFGIPKEEFFYAIRPLVGNPEADKYSFQLSIGDFSSSELDKALPLYSAKYNVAFDPSPIAKDQLKHPLLLRLFCETNQNQPLGYLGSVPVAATFEHYGRCQPI